MFFQSKFSFEKTLPKYFWEVSALSDDSSNTEYISLAVNFSNAITLVFLLDGDLVRHLFQHFFRYYLFFCFHISGIA